MSAQLSARAALEQCLSEIDKAASTCLSQTDFFANTLRTLNPLGISRLVVARKVENNSIYAITASRQLAAGSQNCDSFSVSIETPLDTNTETLIAKVIASNQPLIEIASIAPHNTTNGTVETPDTVFAIPFEPALSCSSVLLIECMSSQLVAEPAAYLQLLAALTESLNRFEYRQTVAELKSQLAASDRFAAFSRRAHQCLSQNRTAVTIANDGRAIVGCERLAVVLSSKGKCRVLAISGAEHIHRLSPTCSQLVQLCNRIIATRTEFRHPNPEIELPPELEAALDDYLEVSPALELTIIPLVAPDDLSPPIGALVFEQFQQPLPSDAKPLLPKLAEHARLALTNATTFESIPGHNWLIAITSRPLVRRLRFGSGMFLGVVTMLALALMLIPAELRLKARGELLPATRQEVFAPLDGIVSTIHVEHGQQVKPGELLLELRSEDLELDIQQVQGELATARQKLATVQAERLQVRPSDTDARLRERRFSAEQDQLTLQVDALEKRLTILDQRRQNLQVRSPIAGEVLTWDLHKRLEARPLRRGDQLLTIGDTNGDWIVEAQLPGRQAGRFLEARRTETGGHSATLTFATSPQQRIPATVEQVAQRTELTEMGEPYLTITLAIPNGQLTHAVPGNTVVARIDCGRASLGKAWFIDFVDAVWLWLP